ncbi:hypothetical protein HMN09_00908000 [Mycena chlorophos]|uniref:DNA replication regulator SLD2 n=1 Tax=Mycena chlorophos TaxID=658473 RepID=A0A8H6W4N3_MYCCL|nr:hypothetical protein HMN09_00908000 [Mycena chlorophos]
MAGGTNELQQLKKEIKEWEHAFRAKHGGRDPTFDEVKRLGFADKYKQYKKLSKDASSSSSNNKPANKSKTRPLLSPARPTASKTQPLPVNPFSPQKNPGKGKQKAGTGEFRLPILEPDPFLDEPPVFNDPTAPTPVVRARKRLRGEPVSPSPNKGKRRRMDEDDDDDDEEGGAANLSFVDDSPAKPSTSFKLLFDEGASAGTTRKSIFPSVRKTLPIPKLSLPPQPAPDAMEVDDLDDNPFLESSLTPTAPNPEPAILLPPSPPPVTKNGRESKARVKGAPKKGKQVATADDDESEEEEEEQKVRVFTRTSSRRAATTEFDEDVGYVRPRRPPEQQQNNETAETTSISLPDNLREMLSLAPSSSTTRARADKHVLVDRLIYGAHRSNYDASKGGEVWGVGEFEGEQLDDMAPRNTEVEQEDDWEGEGVPWEVGEL